jgi:beta-N-acetylglucosaminidase
MLDAFTFVKKDGIVHESDYRSYNGRKSKCESTDSKEKYHNNDMLEEDNISNERIK